MKATELLALLAAAEAQISAELVSHTATWDVYDALPGEEKVASSGPTAWKSGRVGRMSWTVYRPHKPREESEV